MKVTKCTLIIKDDFDNILVLKKKVKRGQVGKWSLLTQSIRGKESDEKCLNKAANKVLKTILFDLQEFKEYVIDSENEESMKVYTGGLKGRFVLDKTYEEAMWVNRTNINSYEFEEMDKQILDDYLGF